MCCAMVIMCELFKLNSNAVSGQTSILSFRHINTQQRVGNKAKYPYHSKAIIIFYHIKFEYIIRTTCG